MTAQVRVHADLTFTLTEPTGEETTGTLSADGTEVRIRVDSLDSVAAGRLPGLEQVRPLAKSIAGQGLTVVVEGPDGPIISLGAVPPARAQRLLTGSPHIRLGKLGVLAPMLKSVRKGRAGGSSLLPPETPWPLMPTVQRKIVRRITTTHHTRGSGRPRLIFVQDAASWSGQVPREFNLAADRVSIGSGASCDLQLSGLDELHAEIVHNEADEYVLVRHGQVTGSFGPAGSSVLRTGARLQMGTWRLAYFREEFADHGRPFGGRSGGEFAYQRPQIDPRTGAIERDGSTGVT